MDPLVIEESDEINEFEVLTRNTEETLRKFEENLVNFPDGQIEKLLDLNKNIKENSEVLRSQLQNFSKDHLIYLETYHSSLLDYENSLAAYNRMIESVEVEVVKKKIENDEKEKLVIESQDFIEKAEVMLESEKEKLKEWRKKGVLHVKWKALVVILAVAFKLYFYLNSQPGLK